MKLKLLSSSKNTAIVGLDFEFSYNDIYKRTVKIAEALPENISKAAIYAENAPEWI